MSFPLCPFIAQRVIDGNSGHPPNFTNKTPYRNLQGEGDGNLLSEPLLPSSNPQPVDEVNSVYCPQGFPPV